MSIGIFDSGLGGVTVLNEVRKIFKYEDIHYFADTARLPYGDKTNEEIISYSREIVEFLIDKNVDIILIACNTATSIALETLKNEYNVKLEGVINSAVKSNYLIESNSIGIIATKATIKTGKYEEELRKIYNNKKIYSKATPLLVPIIENDVLDTERLNLVLNEYLEDMVKNIDVLILGCTHYSIIKNYIYNKYKDLKLVDPSYELAQKLKNEYIEKKENSKTIFYTSGDVKKFSNNLDRVFNIKNALIRKV